MRAIVLAKAHKPRVLDAVALRGRGRENDSLRKILLPLKLHLVVGPGQHPDTLRPQLILAGFSMRLAGVLQLAARASRSAVSPNELPSLCSTRLVKSLSNPSSQSFRWNSGPSYSVLAICRGSVSKLPAGSTSMLRSRWTTPLRKVMEEI